MVIWRNLDPRLLSRMLVLATEQYRRQGKRPNGATAASPPASPPKDTLPWPRRQPARKHG
jgi:hypothetical protein